MTVESYGGSPVKTNTVSAQTVVSVLSTDTALVAANANRVELTITNDHATQVVYLSFGTTAATANNCMRLNAAGGSYTTRSYTGAIRAISVGGTSAVLVLEIG
jgi:hypothetical protein